MLKIDNNNNITLTRGDTLTLTVEPKTMEGEPYEIQEGDSLRFALSKGYAGESSYRLMVEKNIPTNTLTFTLTSTETKLLEYRQYNYDVEITHADNSVDTFISAKFDVTGEAK